MLNLKMMGLGIWFRSFFLDSMGAFSGEPAVNLPGCIFPPLKKNQTPQTLNPGQVKKLRPNRPPVGWEFSKIW